MAKLKWHSVRDVMRQRHVAPAPAPAQEFWADFRRRAGPQLRAQVASERSVPVLPWRLSWVAAAALAMVLAAALALGPLGRRSVAAGGLGSSVAQVDVFVPYSTMMILQDQKTGGALVWVTDLDGWDEEDDT